MKPDEREFLDALRKRGPNKVKPFAFEIAESLGMNYKRAQYLYLKWSERGWWDYGVSARTGWLTEAGMEATP